MFVSIALTVITLCMFLFMVACLWSIVAQEKQGKEVSSDQVGGFFVIVVITFVLILATGAAWDEHMGTSLGTSECEENVAD